MDMVIDNSSCLHAVLCGDLSTLARISGKISEYGQLEKAIINILPKWLAVQKCC